MRRVLMVAYHFPPFGMSSGVQRTYRFARHLPQFGWEPVVLTAHPRAYEKVNPDANSDIPAEFTVIRAAALDAARHFSVFGRFPGFLARPDRWATWRFDAVRVGRRVIRDWRPDVIWSTYPIATAHVIGLRLHELSGLPWVADFRDPMAQSGYPKDPKTWARFRQIEEAAMRRARCCVFTTPGAAREYADRYPLDAGKVRRIENGYDEETFSFAESDAASSGPLNPGRLTLLHSGIVYPEERDPTQLMEALGRMKDAGITDASRLVVRFRAAVHEDFLRDLARQNGVSDLIEIEAPIGYRQALGEMMRADGLLVLQAENCNQQVPAKAYEYLRARRPLLVLADPDGDTANVLRAAGVARTASLNRTEEIVDLLVTFLLSPEFRATLIANESAVLSASREGRTEQLAAVLEESRAATLSGRIE